MWRSGVCSCRSSFHFVDFQYKTLIHISWLYIHCVRCIFFPLFSSSLVVVGRSQHFAFAAFALHCRRYIYFFHSSSSTAAASVGRSVRRVDFHPYSYASNTPVLCGALSDEETRSKHTAENPYQKNWNFSPLLFFVCWLCCIAVAIYAVCCSPTLLYTELSGRVLMLPHI